MADKKPGLTFTISGPSGVGKTVLSKRILADPQIGLRKVVTCTTRPPRDGEVNGRDYNFLSLDDFFRQRDRGEFVETAQVYGHYYGSRKVDLEKGAQEGHTQLMVADVSGALYLKHNFAYPNIPVFIWASIPDLRERLIENRKESEEEVRKRLGAAKQELEKAGEFAYIVNNEKGKFEDALNETRGIIILETTRYQQ